MNKIVLSLVGVLVRRVVVQPLEETRCAVALEKRCIPFGYKHLRRAGN